MNDQLNPLFIDNPDLVEQIEVFCEKDPECSERKREFYETARKIAEITDFQLYDSFEQSFIRYLACANDIYYRFGLGLRQEVLSALQPEVS